MTRAVTVLLEEIMNLLFLIRVKMVKNDQKCLFQFSPDGSVKLICKSG